MVWNRAVSLKGVAGLPRCPASELAFPKRLAKAEFQTWDEIDRALDARPDLTEAKRDELWSSLFLRAKEIEELLAFVQARKTRRRYFYPLMVFAAHTGARLSEMLRSEREDFKFSSREVLIREKKRSQKAETMQRVPMSGLLCAVMDDWFKTGPKSTWAITRDGGQLTNHSLTKVHDKFFAKTKWKVLKGFHVLRHSFASNLAAKGVDQRVIDALMGHQTEEQRQRYRHLFPENRQNAVHLLFG